MFETVVFTHSVHLPARAVGRNVADVVEERARADLEGLCGPHGFVRPGSATVLRRSPGRAVDVDFGRSYSFDLRVRAEVCNPIPGTRVRALVQAHNKIGVLAEAGFFDARGSLVPILEIVVVADTVMVRNEVPVAALGVGDEVAIEILGRVFELHDTRIRAFGRTVESLGEPGDRAGDGTGSVTDSAPAAGPRAPADTLPPGTPAEDGTGAEGEEDDDDDEDDGGDGDGDDEDQDDDSEPEEDGLSDIDGDEQDDEDGDQENPKALPKARAAGGCARSDIDIEDGDADDCDGVDDGAETCDTESDNEDDSF